MIVYKVVTHDRRSCITKLPFFGKGEQNFNRFVLIYDKGTTVFAHPNTQGIITFLIRHEAQNWIDTIMKTFDPGCFIIRCKPIMKGVRKFYSVDYYMLKDLFSHIIKYKENLSWDDYVITPFSLYVGCYPAVEVLD
jgi:hypothetical protein